MDRVLLAVEIVCALIVAWIAVQYVYTVYFDTVPRRLTPSVLPTATRVATATPVVEVVRLTATAVMTESVQDKPTPTLFVEVLPPITGGPGDVDTGVGPAATSIITDTATATPAATATATMPRRCFCLQAAHSGDVPGQPGE